MSPEFGSFDGAGGLLRFVVDDGYTAVEALDEGVEVAVEDLDERLFASKRLPALDGAPVASWLLARLGALVRDGEDFTEARLALSPDTVEHVDDALFVVDFVVLEDELPVAKVQLQGGMIGAGLLGVARDEGTAARVVSAFEATLLAAPDEVAPCRIRTIALDRPAEGLYAYGWDGERFLGAGNPSLPRTE